MSGRRGGPVLLLLLALVSGVASVPSAPAVAAPVDDVELPRGHAALAERIADDGRTHVIVGLRTSFVPEGELDGTAVDGQRDRIGRIADGLEQELAGTDAGPMRRFETLATVVVEVGPSALEALLRSPRVASVEPEAEFTLELDESVALVGADVLHAAGVEGSGRAVAILDTGVDVDHPFFAGRVVAEACFSSGGGYRESVCPDGTSVQIGPGAAEPCPESVCFHGTHVAGIALGAHATYGGVAPAADLIAVQVFHRTVCSTGTCIRASLSDLVAALDHVATLADGTDAAADVAAVNMSLGGGLYSAVCDAQFPAMADAVANLTSKGVAVIVSSGNGGAVGSISSPACLSGAVAVGATRNDDTVTSFSNGHPTLVDLLAPGQSIVSAYPGSSVASASGTSSSAPHVAGAWALLRELRPDDTVAELRDALTGAGVPVTDDRGAEPFTTPRLALAAFEPDPPAEDPPAEDPPADEPALEPDGETEATGLLRVTTAPAVASAISVGGVHRSDWGLDWLSVPVGTHEVCFGDVPGFVTPDCATVEVVAGETTAVEGAFEQLGLLKVDVLPSGLPVTVHVDGEWRDEYGLFSYQAAGTYEVCWGDVADHTAPPCQEAVVTAGGTTTVVGTYEPALEPATGPAPAPADHGYLRVTSAPAVSTTISVDGVTRGDWGLNWVKVPAGAREVCFSGVPGFATPACRTVEVVPGVTATTEGGFDQLGLLRVDVTPSVAIDVRIDGVPRNQFGLYTFFTPGTYEVCGTTAPDGRTAPCVQAVVSPGDATTVVLEYG